MTTRYSLTVAFQKDNGIPDIHASEPGAVLPSSKKKKKQQGVVERMTILYRLSKKVDNLNYQVSFTSSLTATHDREYSKFLSTHLS